MLIETALPEQLDAFGRCGTLSAAAKELHLSQPALTRVIKRLEELVVPCLTGTPTASP